ncbi:SPOR domain-containing protein [Nitratifractor sp.]
MTDHNLDDLIIGEPDLPGGKSKSVLTTLALFAIIVIVGIVLYQLIMGGEETAPKSGEKTALTSIVTHPVRYETGTRRREQIPKELQPIVREKLPTSATQNAGRSHSVSAPETTSIRRPLPAKSISTPVRESKPQTKAPTVSRREQTPKTRAHTPVKAKPSELFKRKEQETKKKPTAAAHKEYFVQVGSFRRPPTKKFLDDMRAKGYRPLLVKSAGMIKVRIGPYPSYADAKAKLPEIKEKLGIAGFVVRKK